MTDTLTIDRRRALVAAGLGGAVALAAPVSAAEAAGPAWDRKHKIRAFGGVYYVQAQAPYVPHLMTFHDDGTMTSTNPTNVQDGPNAGVKVTDSLGMGTWRWMRLQDGWRVLITMVQENALQPARARGPRLHVTALVDVLAQGDEFDGPAVAELLEMQEQGPRVVSVIEAPHSHLTGWRLQERVDQLSRDDRRYLGL